MPLKGKNAASEAAGKKASEVFEGIEKNRPAKSGLRTIDASKYKGATETIGLRIPKGEKTRLKNLFARKGFTLSQALKIALYRFAEDIEAGRATLLDAMPPAPEKPDIDIPDRGV
jgi:hypothetical protein